MERDPLRIAVASSVLGCLLAYDAPHQDRQRVLDSTNIVDVVGEHIALKAKGKEFVCLCPFHEDHKPSMYVVPQKQIYHCFSCGAGGNAFDFVINYHKMAFRDALRFLADRAGIELTPWRPTSGAGGRSEQRDEVSREAVVNANRFACDFFRSVFRHAEHGKLAREAAERRGFTDETIEAFAIGASPDRWDGLLQMAGKKGVSEQDLLAAGLAKARPNGPGSYDAFRNRLIFPIHDQLGRVIAFGGRRLVEEDDPKYLNSPESSVFDKSSTLYGLRQANRSIQREGVAIVVEGYTDVIACHQAGITNVVATLGTALTTRHATALRRLCSTVVLLFDADEAGAKAADRALEVFFAQPIDVKIAVVPGGKDPADLLAIEGGREQFADAIANGVDALDYRFARMQERLATLGESARVQAVEDDLRRLADLGLNRLSPIRRRVVLRRLAALVGVDEETIAKAIPRTGGASNIEGKEAQERRAFTPGEHALGCLLLEPSLAGRVGGEFLDFLAAERFADEAVREIALFVAQAGDDTTDLTRAMAELESAQSRSLAAALASHAQDVTESDPERLAAHFEQCLRAAARFGESLDPTGRRAKHGGTIDEQLAALRERQRRLGGDPLALPRPSASAPPG